MEWLKGDTLIEIIALAASAISVYAAIRSDLILLHAKDEMQENAIKEIKMEARETRGRLNDHIESHSYQRREADNI